MRQFTVGARGYRLNDFCKGPRPANFEFVSISGAVLDSGVVLLT
jgi:hypothetical protein